MNIFTLPQSAGGVLLGVAILLTAGFLMTRLTRRLHLPNVTGYILAGILVGPYALNLIPAWLSGGMEFVTDLALSYIAFSAGRYFRIADLKRSGGKVLAVTLAEALCAAVAVTLTMIFVFRLSVPFALLLGAIGCATAPASTIMTIRQYRAKGPFVNLLLQVTALDDAVALTAFSVCTAVVNALQTGHIQFADVALPLLWNLGAVALGLALAVLLRWLAGQGHSQAHTLVLVNAVLLFLSGLCSTLGISPLLACMALGAGYVNLGGEKRLFKRMDKFSPPFLLLFFALSGVSTSRPSQRRALSAWPISSYASQANTRGPAAVRRCAAPTRPSSNIWASLSRLRPAFPSVLPCWANACCLRPKARCWLPSSFPPLYCMS